MTDPCFPVQGDRNEYFGADHISLQFFATFGVCGITIHKLLPECGRVLVAILLMYLIKHPDTSLANDCLQWLRRNLQPQNYHWPAPSDLDLFMIVASAAYFSRGLFEKVVSQTTQHGHLWALAIQCLHDTGKLQGRLPDHLQPIQEHPWITKLQWDTVGHDRGLPHRLKLIGTACSAVLQHSGWRDGSFISLVDLTEPEPSKFFPAVAMLVLRAACPSHHPEIPVTQGLGEVCEVFGELPAETRPTMLTYRKHFRAYEALYG